MGRWEIKLYIHYCAGFEKEATINSLRVSGERNMLRGEKKRDNKWHLNIRKRKANNYINMREEPMLETGEKKRHVSNFGEIPLLLHISY